jgi:hypothetical protein
MENSQRNAALRWKAKKSALSDYAQSVEFKVDLVAASCKLPEESCRTARFAGRLT